jgi:hypothetical protein
MERRASVGVTGSDAELIAAHVAWDITLHVNLCAEAFAQHRLNQAPSAA